MKTVLALSFLLLLISCTTKYRTADGVEISEDSFLQAELVADSLAEIEELKEELKNDSLAAVTAIRIKKFYTTAPNSAGGVDFNITWQNKSEKVIKYATFTVEPYNAVDDVVQCSIRGNSEFHGQVTGPIEKDKWSGNDGSLWSNAWYNYTIKKIKIKEVSLEYMDGSKLEINGKAIDYITQN